MDNSDFIHPSPTYKQTEADKMIFNLQNEATDSMEQHKRKRSDSGETNNANKDVAEKGSRLFPEKSQTQNIVPQEAADSSFQEVLLFPISRTEEEDITPESLEAQPVQRRKRQFTN